MAFFNIGTRVKTRPVPYHDDATNLRRANRIATVIDVVSLPALPIQFIIRYDEPYYEFGYRVEKDWCYEDALEAVKEESSQ